MDHKIMQLIAEDKKLISENQMVYDMYKWKLLGNT